MELLLQLFVIVPFIGYLISLFISENREKELSTVAFSTVGIQLIGLIGYTIFWLLSGHKGLNLKDVVVYKSEEYEFYIDFYFDRVTAVFSLVGAFLTFLITIYSRVYLHRENGYKRFFNTILFFFTGYNLTVFSGNFETLFMGWEVLGISSFLLIAFYRERYLPVKNALKVFFIYRIGDIGLILAMWLSHHLWHENISFARLSNAEIVHDHLLHHSLEGVIVSLLVLVAAYAKSAQLPFSSWLPRAMEGPTPSSAIFYGSLSVHLGAFLMMRTYPFFENQLTVRIVMIVFGILTSFIAMNIARVQSSVKSQIAYASIGQIGLIFIEIALGFEKIALIHFAGNAFLRTYQLLVSPSVASYLIREQFFHFTPVDPNKKSFIPQKIRNSIYLLSIKEWNLDDFNYAWLWHPLKRGGRIFKFLRERHFWYIFLPVYLLGVLGAVYKNQLNPAIEHGATIVFALCGLVMVLRSFAEYKNIMMSWWMIALNHFWIALAVSYNENFSINETILYLSGVFVAGILGDYVLKVIRRREGSQINLFNYNGFAVPHKKLAFIFLLCGLGIVGFPITPTFIGEDLIFSHIHEGQFLLAGIISVSFIIDGLSMVRIYARLFLGPYIKDRVITQRAA